MFRVIVTHDKHDTCDRCDPSNIWDLCDIRDVSVTAHNYFSINLDKEALAANRVAQLIQMQKQKEFELGFEAVHICAQSTQIICDDQEVDQAVISK